MQLILLSSQASEKQLYYKKLSFAKIYRSFNSLFQIHEYLYEPFVSGENNVEGRFTLDPYSGINTTFKVNISE